MRWSRFQPTWTNLPVLNMETAADEAQNPPGRSWKEPAEQGCEKHHTARGGGLMRLWGRTSSKRRVGTLDEILDDWEQF